MMVLEAVSMVQRAASHVRKGTVQPSKPWERFHYLAVTYHKLLGFQGPTKKWGRKNMQYGSISRDLRIYLEAVFGLFRRQHFRSQDFRAWEFTLTSQVPTI